MTWTKTLVLLPALFVAVAACASPEPAVTRDTQRTLTSVQITAETLNKTQRAKEATATPQTTDTPAPTRTVEPTEAPKVTPEPTDEPTLPEPSTLPAPAGEGAANADVLFVRAVEAADGRWTFHVTVEHPDTGWEDYADGWDVLTPDGEVLKTNPDDLFTRLLLHPHENEQPFTRSQSGIVIPEGVMQVRVRAHDLVDGYGGREVAVDLTLGSGPDFEVER